MEDNFLVEIIDFESIKQNNINFNNTNIYCLWYDKNELEKILISSPTKTHSYLSCFFSSNTDKLTELIDSYVMIFLKNPKILYSFVKIHSIILKDISSKSYLEDIDEEYTSILLKNDSIFIDNNEFNSIIKQYKYVEIPKMFLIKFYHLYQFKFEIGIKKFNDYILTIDENDKKYLEFKYPTKVQNKEIVKCYDINFINNLIKYINYLQNKYKTTKLVEESKISTNIIQNKFCIPVLWNCCECIKNMLVYQNIKPNKKTIISHYSNCDKCEIIDNNNKIINLNNKKIIINNINENIDTYIFDSLINSYKNIEFYNIDNSFPIEKDKLNIISCSKSSSIYSECLFIVE